MTTHVTLSERMLSQTSKKNLILVRASSTTVLQQSFFVHMRNRHTSTPRQDYEKLWNECTRGEFGGISTSQSSRNCDSDACIHEEVLLIIINIPAQHGLS